MFRRSCVALALVLILAVTPLPAAQADPIPNDVQAAPVEAQVAESASAAALEGTGLAMEDAADAVFAPQPTEALPPSPTEEVIAVTYARAARADCPVYAGPDASLPIGRVAEGGVVLLPRGAAEGRVAAAFCAGNAVVDGYMDSETLELLDAEELRAYLDAAVDGGALLYEGSLNFPLLPVDYAPEASEPTAEPISGPVDGEEELDLAAVTVAVTPAPTATEDPEQRFAAFRLSASELSIGVKEVYTKLRLESDGGDGDLPDDMGGVTWSSGNKKIAKVNSRTGAITGVKKGTTTITAKAADGTTYTCTVNVKKAPSKVTVTAESAELSAGMTTPLTVKLSSKAASGHIRYKSSNKKVAKVSANGTVTAVAPGSVKITATAYNGKKGTCKITVVEAPVGVSLSTSEYTLGVGQGVTPKFTARSADGATVPARFTYTVSPLSQDPGCVKVSASGKITAVRKGRASVTATTQNGCSATCSVTVLAAPSGIKLSAKSVTIGKAEIYTGITAELTAPKGEPDCAAKVKWYTSDKTVVKINSKTGAITGVKTGTAKIYAKTHNGKKSAKCTVTVKKAPSKLTLTPSSAQMSVGMGLELSVSLTKNSASGWIGFKSSKKKVAKVDANGMVIAVAPGTATITATAFNGKKDTCKITVVGAPATASFDASSYTVGVGDAMTLEPEALDAAGEAVPAAFTFAVSPNSPDPDCVRLDPDVGRVTAVRRGEAMITATTQNGVSASCMVVVPAAPVAIDLSRSSATIGVGEAYKKLTAELTPPDGESDCGAKITWYTENKAIAKVNDETGVVTGVKKGTTYIYAKTSNGLQSAKCKVTVKNAPSSIALTPATASLRAGETGQYRVTFPSGCGGSVAFESSNTDVAVVDEGGKVTALQTGTAVITATSYNGKRATSNLSVNGATLTTRLPDQYAFLQSTVTHYDPSMSNAQKLEYVVYVAESKYGCPYNWGSEGPDRFDCSGLTYYCFKQIGITLERSSYKQGNDSRYAKITKISDLKRGDLVFFDTNESDGRRQINHAGLYLGSGYFIHASSGSSKMKVVIDQFVAPTTNFYERTFWWGYRVLS